MEGLIEALIEILLETFGELILQVIVQSLAEVGFHHSAKNKQDGPPRSPVLLLPGYALLGIFAGGLSLLAFSQSLAHTRNGRLATLLLVPFLASASSVLIGRLRVRKGQTPAGLDRFMHAYLFALSVACVRYLFTA